MELPEGVELGEPKLIEGGFALEETQDFITTQVPKPETYPYRTIGKLFLRRTDIPYNGTAVVVNKTGLMTAAHNLYNPTTKTWSTNMAFYPAYSDGYGPFDAWVFQPSDCYVSQQWYMNGDYAYDLAFVRTGLGGRYGQLIGDVTGWLGLQINQKLDERTFWYNTGYPSEAIPGYNFDGEKMWECLGPFMGWSGYRISKGDNLSRGASGSPWLMFNNNSSANGVYSTGTSDHTKGFSPYFGDWTSSLYYYVFPQQAT